MEHTQTRKRKARKARVYRVRRNIIGSAQCPRMSVQKSNKHLYVQLIDDQTNRTLCGIGTCSKKTKGKATKSKEHARHLGSKIAQLAQERNVQSVIFDRGRYKFHGLIAELATAAREAGLQF
jgi:large subunit ribosomal protein L18